MSRIDVVPAEKDKWKVLVNFIQHGVDFASPDLADSEAEKIKKEHYPKADMHLRGQKAVKA